MPSMSHGPRWTDRISALETWIAGAVPTGHLLARVRVLEGVCSGETSQCMSDAIETLERDWLPRSPLTPPPSSSHPIPRGHRALGAATTPAAVSTLGRLPDEAIATVVSFLHDVSVVWPLRPAATFPLLLQQQRSAFAELLHSHGRSYLPENQQVRFMARCPPCAIPLRSVSLDHLKQLRADYHKTLSGGEWQVVARPKRVLQVRTPPCRMEMLSSCTFPGPSGPPRPVQALDLVLAFLTRKRRLPGGKQIRPVVMGGFPFSCFFDAGFEDIDVFMVQPESAKQKRLHLPAFVASVAEDWASELLECAGIDMSAAAIVHGVRNYVLMFEYRGAVLRFQFVSGVFSSISALLLSSDIGITQICLDWRGKWWVTPEWLRATALRTVFVDPHFQNPDIAFARYPRRLLKYYGRGLQVAVPSNRFGGPDGPTAPPGSFLEALLQMFHAGPPRLDSKGQEGTSQAQQRNAYVCPAAPATVVEIIASLGGFAGMTVKPWCQCYATFCWHLVERGVEFCVSPHETPFRCRDSWALEVRGFEPLGINYGYPVTAADCCHPPQDQHCPALALRKQPANAQTKTLNDHFWRAWRYGDWHAEGDPLPHRHLVFSPDGYWEISSGIPSDV